MRRAAAGILCQPELSSFPKFQSLEALTPAQTGVAERQAAPKKEPKP